MSKYWLVTYNQLSVFGESSTTDSWEGSLVDFWETLEKSTENCNNAVVYTITWTHEITKQEYLKFRGEE